MATDFISRKDAKDKHCEICEHLNICYQYDGDDCRTYTGRTCIERQCFNAIPAADVVEVVRCKDCNSYNRGGCPDGYGACMAPNVYGSVLPEDFFCKYGRSAYNG